MRSHSRRFLAEIGRRGGIRSRRALTADQARAMVQSREARRAAVRFPGSPWFRADVPGCDLVAQGLRDLADQVVSDEALLVSMAAPRLRLLGIRVPRVCDDPEQALQHRLSERYGDAAHGRYNALVRRMVAFQRSAPLVSRPSRA